MSMTKLPASGAIHKGEPLEPRGVPVEQKLSTASYYGAVRVSPTELIRDRIKPTQTRRKR